MSDKPAFTATLKLSGTDVAAGSVSIDVLVRVLSGVQQTTYLLGAAREKKSIQQRFKPSEELRRQYRLRCLALHGGSFEVPIALEGQPELGFPDKPPVLEELYGFLEGVMTDSDDLAQRSVPDSRIRDRMLREVIQFLPRPGQRWSLEYKVGNRPPLLMDVRTLRHAEAWLASPDPADAVMTVTGHLIRIDFDLHKVVIRYPPTNREIDCVYVPELEDTMLESRRQLIQVTGKFTLDDDNNPVKLMDVTRIEPVDLSPMVFDRFEWNGRVLEPTVPISLEPVLDEDCQHLILVDERLGIDVFAATREELADELQEQVFFLWDAYAVAESAELGPAALELQKRLKSSTKAGP
jgi:hypothetical protein